MINQTCFTLAAVLTVGPVSLAAGQSLHVPQSRIAQWVQNDNQSVREAALAEALRIDPNAVEKPLGLALVAELVRLNSELSARGDARRAGRSLPPSTLGPYHGALVEAVSQLDDPSTIPALVGSIGTGQMVARALVKYGEASVVPVASSARMAASPMDAAASLRVLTALLRESERRLRPISTLGMRRMLDAARNRMAGTQHPSVIAAACELSIETGDPQLRARVEELAREGNSVVALGVRDPELIRLVQSRAQQALRSR